MMRVLRIVTLTGTALLLALACVSCGGGGQKTPTTNELADLLETATQEQVKATYGYPTAVLYESADVVVWVYQEGGETVPVEVGRQHPNVSRARTDVVFFGQAPDHQTGLGIDAEASVGRPAEDADLVAVGGDDVHVAVAIDVAHVDARKVVEALDLGKPLRDFGARPEGLKQHYLPVRAQQAPSLLQPSFRFGAPVFGMPGGDIADAPPRDNQIDRS